jgi:hypothetical protein
MVLTLLQDIVKLMFEMTNASECHRDAVSFAAAIDSSSLIDPPRLETGVRLAPRLLSLWESLGEDAEA